MTGLGGTSVWLLRGRERLRRLVRLTKLRGRPIRLYDAIASGGATTIFLSVHKGASSFLSNWLGPAMERSQPPWRHLELHTELLRGRSLEELKVPATRTVVTRVYPAHYSSLIEDPEPPGGRFTDKKLILLRRDPRDVAVSLYYSWAFSHGAPPVERLRQRFEERRERLRRLGPEAGILRVAAPAAIREFRSTVELLDRHPHTLLTTYEQLVEAFPHWLSGVGEYLGWNRDGTTALAELLASELRPPAKENRYRHKRRVTPEAWRDHFSEPHRKLFETELGDLLGDAGYRW